MPSAVRSHQIRLNDSMTEMADLPTAARASVAALAGYTDLDWQQVPAAGLQWSCWKTALHMVDCLYFYTMQVVYGNPDTYLCTELALDDSASPPRLLAALSAHADLLHRIARSADPDTRAHHNYGVSDPAGFAAMGVVETLIHTFDVVRGLNPADPWRPPAGLAAPVIARLFPHAPSGDPTDVLMYCCGRATLGDLPQQTEWQWDGTVRT
jgi:DinB superfamily